MTSLPRGDEPERTPLKERRERNQERLSFEILTNPPDKDTNGDVIGFTPYFTTQFGLPHSRVDGNIWQRKNGNQTLSITTACPYGLPSGSIPRLLLAWVATWQVRHPNQTVIELGKNVSRFLEHELELPRTGRYIRDVRMELIRLFSATISVVTVGDAMYKHKARPLSNDFELWGAPQQRKDQDALFPSYIELTKEFHESLLDRPVPLDLRALALLKSSSLAMDYYVWFTKVMFNLQKSRLVPWEALHQQLGSAYNWNNKHGRHTFKVESKHQIVTRILKAYPTLRVTPGDDGIMLHPSPTPVPHVPSRRYGLPGVRARREQEMATTPAHHVRHHLTKG